MRAFLESSRVADLRRHVDFPLETVGGHPWRGILQMLRLTEYAPDPRERAIWELEGYSDEEKIAIISLVRLLRGQSVGLAEREDDESTSDDPSDRRVREG